MAKSRSALSVLPAHLIEKVADQYQLGPDARCELLHAGYNDTYLVESNRRKTILRVYGGHRRTANDIDVELRALEYASDRGASVSTPIRREDGQFGTWLRSDEMRRFAVMFSFAEGHVDPFEDPHKPYQYGVQVALLHSALDGFADTGKRIALDRRYLVDDSVALAEARLGKVDRQYLRHVAANLGERLDTFTTELLDYGFCHGDLQGGNCHWVGDSVTHFDFDFGGFGWRAYDVAVFKWNAEFVGADWWPHFERGYASQRPLGEAERAAIPLFVVARHVWMFARWIELSRDRGNDFVSGQLTDQVLGMLRRLDLEIGLTR